MSDTNQSGHDEQQGENLNAAEPRKTPLEQVKEQQAMQQESRDAVEHSPEATDEIPGHSIPSDKRHHPQRQMYGSGTNES